MFLKKEKMIYFFVEIIPIILFFLICLFMPRLVDDYNIRINGSLDNIEKIKIIILSLKRCTAFCRTVASPMPRILYAFINTSIVFILLFSIYKISGSDKFALIITIISYIIVIEPGQVLFWRCGASVYLWPLTISMLYLMLYEYQLKSKNNIINLLLFPLAYFCGTQHGAVGGVIFIIVFLMSIYYKCYENKKQIVLIVIQLILLLIGMYIMVTTPSQVARYSKVNEKLYMIFIRQCFGIIQNFTPLCMILFSMITIVIYQNKIFDINFKKALIYLIAALCGLFALTVVPASNRAFMFFPFLSSISLTYLIKTLKYDKHISGTQFKVVFFALIIIVISQEITRFYDVVRINSLDKERINTILSAVKEDKNTIKIISFSNWQIYQRFTGNLSDLQYDENCEKAWENIAMQNYFGIKEIKGIDWNLYK